MRHRASEKISLAKLKQIANANKAATVSGPSSAGSTSAGVGTVQGVALGEGAPGGGGPGVAALRASASPGKRSHGGGAVGVSRQADVMGLGADEGDRVAVAAAAAAPATAAEFDTEGSSCRRFSFSSVSSAATLSQRVDDAGWGAAGMGCDPPVAGGSLPRKEGEWAGLVLDDVTEQKSIAVHAAPVISLDEATRRAGKSSGDPGACVGADAGGPEDLSTILKEWADDFDKAIEGFFSKNKLFDLFGLWTMILLLDASLSSPTRIEWLGFCVLSFSPLHRCVQTSIKVTLCLILFYVSCDVAFYFVFKALAHPKLLPTLANMIVYGHVIGCIRGLDPISWGLWASLLAVDLMAKDPPVSEVESLPAIHCVSYGFYLMLTELFTLLTEYRNERLASNDAVYGELRLYPVSLMTGSVFSKDVVSATTAAAAAAAAAATADGGTPGGGGGGFADASSAAVAPAAEGSPRPLYAAGDPRSDASKDNDTPLDTSPDTDALSTSKATPKNPPIPLASQASTPPAASAKTLSSAEGAGGRLGLLYYYSNHYDTMNRFELCVRSVSGSQAALAFSLPRSLVVTLGGMVKLETVAEAQVKSSITGLKPPPPVICLHAGDKDEPEFGEQDPSGTTLTFRGVPPLTDPIVIAPADVRVTMNGEDWSGPGKLRLCLREMQVFLDGLKVGVVNEIIMSIKGYSSVPLRICTTKDSGVLAPPAPLADRQGRSSEQPAPASSSDAPPSPIEALQRHRDELAESLEQETETKKVLQNNLKRIRKENSKALASLRAEIDAMKRSIAKDSVLEIKSKQRVQALHEQLRQVEASIELLKEENAEADEISARLTAESEAAAREVATLKEALKKAEKAASKETAAQAKAVALAEADLKEADEAHQAAKRALEKCREEVQRTKAECQSLQQQHRKAPRKQQRAAKAAEDHRKKLEAEVSALEKEVTISRNAYENAVERNMRVKQSVQDEVILKEQLQETYRRLELEALRRQEMFRATAEIPSPTRGVGFDFAGGSSSGPSVAGAAGLGPIGSHRSEVSSGWASFVNGGIFPALSSELQTWEMINRNIMAARETPALTNTPIAPPSVTVAASVASRLMAAAASSGESTSIPAPATPLTAHTPPWSSSPFRDRDFFGTPSRSGMSSAPSPHSSDSSINRYSMNLTTHSALVGLDGRSGMGSRPSKSFLHTAGAGAGVTAFDLDPLLAFNPTPNPVLVATAAEDLKQGYDHYDPFLNHAGEDILSSLGLDGDGYEDVDPFGMAGRYELREDLQQLSVSGSDSGSYGHGENQGGTLSKSGSC
ncbi:hypothetical protein HDU96_003717 [Phlyctochytrium bullatum]|nr:hypothetical protein HDU96_003717 [Phlyctochytrium bullatum]